MALNEYPINKGINRSIQFKGVKGIYILWMGGGLLTVFLLFVLMRLSGINVYACVITALAIGTALITIVSRLSRLYGQFGLMKKMAERRIPKELRSYSRKVFIKVNK